MSLESQLERLNGNIEALVEVMSKGGAAPAKTTSKPAAKTEDGGSDDGKAAGKTTTTRKSTTKASGGKSTTKAAAAKKPEITEEELRAALGDFLQVDDEDERNSRKEWFKENILGEYEEKRATDIDAKHWGDVIAAVKAEAAARDEAGEEEESEDDDMV